MATFEFEIVRGDVYDVIATSFGLWGRDFARVLRVSFHTFLAAVRYTFRFFSGGTRTVFQPGRFSLGRFVCLGGLTVSSTRSYFVGEGAGVKGLRFVIGSAYGDRQLSHPCDYRHVRGRSRLPIRDCASLRDRCGYRSEGVDLCKANIVSQTGGPRCV